MYHWLRTKSGRRCKLFSLKQAAEPVTRYTQSELQLMKEVACRAAYLPQYFCFEQWDAWGRTSFLCFLVKESNTTKHTKHRGQISSSLSWLHATSEMENCHLHTHTHTQRSRFIIHKQLSGVSTYMMMTSEQNQLLNSASHVPSLWPL